MVTIDVKDWTVYWIVSASDAAVPLYVGVTSDIKRRLRQHKSSGIISIVKGRYGIDDAVLLSARHMTATSAAARHWESIEIRFAQQLNSRLLNRRIRANAGSGEYVVTYNEQSQWLINAKIAAQVSEEDWCTANRWKAQEFVLDRAATFASHGHLPEFLDMLNSVIDEIESKHAETCLVNAGGAN